MVKCRYGEIHSVRFYLRVGGGPNDLTFLDWLNSLVKARHYLNGGPCWERDMAPSTFKGAELYIRFTPSEAVSRDEADQAFQKVVTDFNIDIRSYPDREPGMSYIFLDNLFNDILGGKGDGRFRVLGLDLDDATVVMRIGDDPHAFFEQHIAGLLDSAPALDPLAQKFDEYRHVGM